MITEQQLLSIDLTIDEGKQELIRVAGEVLQPEKTEHVLGMPIGRFEARCDKCYGVIAIGDVSECIPDPIPLTWQEAMKWRKHTNDHLPLLDRLITLKDIGMIYNKTYSKYLEWWALEAESYHWLLWSVLCEIRSKG